ncbi:MAG: DUF4199 domain-containing protein [Bacteroidia bacterium]|nr:DUF4199 domain-containing protein [Bacteroidia bacterium]
MGNKKTLLIKSSMIYGAVLSLPFIFISLIVYFFDLRSKSLWTEYIIYFVNLIVFIIGLILTMKAYRNNYNKGFLTYGQALVSGILTSFFMGIVYCCFYLLLNTVIEPGYQVRMLEAKQNQLYEILDQMPADNPGTKYMEQSIEAMDEAKEQISVVRSALGIPVSVTITGALLSLIIAAAVKRKPSAESIGYSNDMNIEDNKLS